MKWLALGALVGFAAFAVPASAQKIETLPIGTFAQIEDKAPTTWAISGFEIFHLVASANGDTPIVRSEKCDARTVEIFSRAIAPPLRASDFKAIGNNVVVRRYLLLTVTPQDAKAEGMSSPAALAQKWAVKAKQLTQVQPKQGPYGL